LVEGSVLKWEGQVSIICGDDMPCYRCLFPICPFRASPSAYGVFGIGAHIIGCIMAMETIKLVIGTVNLRGCMLIYDMKALTSKTFKLRKRSE